MIVQVQPPSFDKPLLAKIKQHLTWFLSDLYHPIKANAQMNAQEQKDPT